MKKYMILLILTGMTMGLLQGVNQYVHSIPIAAVFTAVEADTKRFIKCVGTIEEEGVEELHTDFPLCARSIFVKVGERVKKGELIAVIDQEKTVELLSEAYGASLGVLSSTGVSPEVLLGIINEQEETIPKRVYAPVAGVVTELNLDKDQLSSAKMPIVSISTGGTRYVLLQIPESDIAAVKEGQNVLLTGAGFEKEYNGVVERIADKAVSNNGEPTIEVRVQVLEYDTDFRTGLTAEAKIEIETISNAVVIPHESVLIDEACNEYVMIYKNGKVEKQEITVKCEVHDGYVVDEGIERGDVILKENSMIRIGSRVRPEYTEINEEE